MKPPASVPRARLAALLPAVAISIALSLTAPTSVAASAPVIVPFFDQFVDLNPCSGLQHTVTITGTALIEATHGARVVHVQRTVTTSSGFEGRGAQTIVDNGNIVKVTLADLLSNESGDRIRAQVVILIDPSTGTVELFRGAVTCVGS